MVLSYFFPNPALPAGHTTKLYQCQYGHVPVRDLPLESGGQVDDADGVEGTLLHADAAAVAQALT